MRETLLDLAEYTPMASAALSHAQRSPGLPAAVSGVLAPLAGVSPGVTSQAAFETEYNEMVDQLLAGESGLEGVLVGVVRPCCRGWGPPRGRPGPTKEGRSSGR